MNLKSEWRIEHMNKTTRMKPVGKLYQRKDVERLAQDFRAAYPDFKPEICLYTGTGFASFASEIQESVTLAFKDLPYFPAELQVPMHVGEFVLGKVSGVQVILVRGKMFLLDGVPAQLIALPVRLSYLLGCRTLIYTNTTGAINPSFQPGEFAFLTNHINLMAQNPLVGERNGEWGQMFFDMTYPYDAGLRALGEQVAASQGLKVQEGVYSGVLGPSFETAAEIQMLARVGGDVVGMSTVMEVVAARQLGMKVLGISFISNMAAGVSAAPVENEDVQRVARTSQETFARLVSGVIAKLRDSPHGM
jgi:purine-nucleoside phosphorylase